MRRPHLLALAVAAAVVAADLSTKRWAASSLAGGPLEVVPGILTFRYTENPGAAFGILPGAGSWLGVAAVVAVAAVLWVLRTERPIWEVVGLGLVMGGAMGNFVDRIARGPGWLDGRVIDWVKLPNWPTFNLADSAITVAVVVMVIGAWRTR